MADTTHSPQAMKRLIENLQTDLRSLSSDCKRKYPPVKEAAEAGLLKIRNLMGRQQDIVTGLQESGVEIVHPFILGCDTKNPKIVSSCLMSLQRLIQHQLISPAAVNGIIDTLWVLMESGTEELKLLQTVILLITTSNIVQQQALSKALVLCFRLHFGKDSVTINTAAATVRQLVTSVFERVVMDDTKPPTGVPPVTLEELKASRHKPPPTLSVSAADAFMMFQDICHLVNAEQPTWLLGMTEMTRTFGLELIESVLTGFPHVFTKHMEFSFLLKERVCPLIIKLFSPSLKYKTSTASSSSGNSASGSSGSPSSSSDKPYFPIVMRLLRLVSVLTKQYAELLVTECEIFLTLLVKFLDPEKPLWQRTLALEVLYKLCYHPVLIQSFCAWYDMKPHSSRVLQDIVNGLASFVQSQFVTQSSNTSAPKNDTSGNAPALVAGMPVGAGVTPQPAFCYRNVWIPLVLGVPTPAQQHKPVCLDMMDRIDPPSIADGYALSVAFLTMLEIVRCIHAIVERTAKEMMNTRDGGDLPSLGAIDNELLNSSWCGVLAALTLLLDASTDESATEAILKALQQCAFLCGKLNMSTARDAFMTALCKASLPPHYSLTVLSSNSQHGHARVPSHGRSTSVSSDNGGSNTSSSAPGSPDSTMPGNQVVAVGTPLPQANHPLGVQQGQVMLTAKNIQCMRALLNMAHCHGGVLGTAWHQVLTTLQHLSWILGLKPAYGGSLKADQKGMESSNAVITTAVMADLPVLSQMLSRLFESSQYLDDVALHHLIDALCQLCTEAIELASANKEPSLFAVAKLLETGLVNLSRVQVLWKPVMAKLFEVCQHQYNGLRHWGAEGVTALTKAALAYNYSPPLQEQPKLQAMLLRPLQDLSTLTYSDIRQKQLECVMHVLHGSGERLARGWPPVLEVIGAVKQQHSENLVRTAFTCLQLVCTDFLPTMPCVCLQPVVDVAAKFGLQHQELNVSLTAVGLLWDISDHFYQHRVRITNELNLEEDLPWRQPDIPAFDALWMCVYARLGDLCVDSRPAVRKSAGQTLFSMLGAHGNLLQKPTWHNVLWSVLFPLLEQVARGSGEASTSKQAGEDGGNILIHHSRDTAQKQWAETQVLSLAGVARVFSSKRSVLHNLGNFQKAWSLLLDYIEKAALCKNSEVSLAALKSFQEMLQIRTESNSLKDEFQHLFENPHKKPEGVIIAPPISERMMRSPITEEPASIHKPTEKSSKENQQEMSRSESTSVLNDSQLWLTAWKVWLNIGTAVTTPPEIVTDQSGAASIKESASGNIKGGGGKDQIYIPSQAFLTALVRIFPPLYEHIKASFGVDDIRRLYGVLQQALAVPVHSDSSPFILPVGDLALTGLQQAVLDAVQVLQKDILSAPDSAIFPELYQQLLTLVSYAIKPPRFGQLEAKSVTQGKTGQSDWVSMNYVPLAEGVLRIVVTLYTHTATHKSVIEGHILKQIIQTLHTPLALKYGCPSQSTWKLAIESLLSLLQIALPIAAKHENAFKDIWPELADTINDFLFPKTAPPPTLSMEEFQRDEAIDCKVVEMIRKDILSHPSIVPKEFVAKIMDVLNKGSIHSAASNSFIDIDSSKKLREEFAKYCFETLLQFSFLSPQEKEGCITNLAVSSLLERCQSVLEKYVNDEKLSGKCPLPRPRVSEMSFVLKAVSTLMSSLKKAPKQTVDAGIWKQVIALYPALVRCTVCSSQHVCQALQEALLQYHDLLVTPTQSSSTPNGTS